MPRGGPDGGDGGRGGDVVLVCDPSRRDLAALRSRPTSAAGGAATARAGQARRARGGRGGPRPAGHAGRGPRRPRRRPRRAGPAGDRRRGGRGGHGNKRFTSSTRQAPRFAERGLPGESGWIELRLKLLADAGLVGLPNAGKSSLLARLTRAAPKVADYPFTTLEPVLGTIDDGERQLVLADIPGLIEGAAEGVGLGHEFLAHVERCRVLVHLVASTPGWTEEATRSPLRDRPRGARRARRRARGAARDRRALEGRPAPPTRRGAEVARRGASALGDGRRSGDLLGDRRGARRARRARLRGDPARGAGAGRAAASRRSRSSTWSTRPPATAASRSCARTRRSASPGRGVEMLVARHDLSNLEALAYLEQRLREIGVIAALERGRLRAGRRGQDRRGGVRAAPRLAPNWRIGQAVPGYAGLRVRGSGEASWSWRLRCSWSRPATADVKAGAAVADASWHVGASAGQYASDGTFGVDPDDGHLRPDHPLDPPRDLLRDPVAALQVRALVVQGPAGNRFAIAKTDQYIPQDLLYRRAGPAARDRGRLRDRRSAPDDDRHARPLVADVLVDVVGRLGVPGRLRHPLLQLPRAADLRRRSRRPATSSCRSGSAPRSASSTRPTATRSARRSPTTAARPATRSPNTDHDLSVVRFDDVSDPEHPKPLANLVNCSGHPEFLEGNDLISRRLRRPRRSGCSTGRPAAVTIWTAGRGRHRRARALELPLDPRAARVHPPGVRAGRVRGAPADRRAGRHLGRDRPGDSAGPRPLRPVRRPTSRSRFDRPLVPGPVLASVSRRLELPRRPDAAGRIRCCRSSGCPTATRRRRGCATSPTWSGCRSRRRRRSRRSTRASTTDDFEALGHPGARELRRPRLHRPRRRTSTSTCRGSASARSYLPICSCEQWYDQSENIETRTDKIAGNEYVGYDWGAQCTADGNGTYEADGTGTGTWTCPNPGNPSQTLPPISDLEYRRMRAQVNNPANGWNDIENVGDGRVRAGRPARHQGQLHAGRRGRPRAGARLRR